MRISFIGSGNVANHLSKEFHKKGHEIVSIFSTNDTTGKKLAAATKAKFINHPKDLDTSSDVLILAVPDDQIQKVAKMLAKIFQRTSTIICHTSGTTDLKQISKFYDNSGIFYPLQSFSVLKEVDFSEIPICINANNEHVFGILKTLGATISEHVQALGDADRKILHVSAVFANNYSNYMYVIAEQICKDHQLNFALLRPLIKMTAEKVMHNAAEQMQTGPAKRKDVKVISEHLKFLKDYPEYHSIYKLISTTIKNHYS